MDPTLAEPAKLHGISSRLNPKDLSDEEWREYVFDGEGMRRVIYKINAPKALVIGTTTHRVLDSEGVVHCVPSVGHKGCILRWKVRQGQTPIAF